MAKIPGSPTFTLPPFKLTTKAPFCQVANRLQKGALKIIQDHLGFLLPVVFGYFLYEFVTKDLAKLLEKLGDSQAAWVFLGSTSF